MEPANIDATIIEGYANLLDGLSPASKLDLIARLTASIKSDMEKKQTTFEEAFGAWHSEETAEELIDAIRSSRTFTRKTENF
jgi:hypothetical protein